MTRTPKRAAEARLVFVPSVPAVRSRYDRCERKVSVPLDEDLVAQLATGDEAIRSEVERRRRNRLLGEMLHTLDASSSGWWTRRSSSSTSGSLVDWLVLPPAVLDGPPYDLDDVLVAEACHHRALCPVGLKLSEPACAVGHLHLVHRLAREGRAVALPKALFEPLQVRLVFFGNSEPDGLGSPVRHCYDCRRSDLSQSGADNSLVASIGGKPSSSPRMRS